MKYKTTKKPLRTGVKELARNASQYFGNISDQDQLKKVHNRIKKKTPLQTAQESLQKALTKFESEPSAELRERIDIWGKIIEGEKAIEEGRVISHEEAKKQFSKWLE